MLVHAVRIYFAMLPAAVLGSHLFLNGMTRHGHIPAGISKNNYWYFYLHGLVLMLLLAPGNMYCMHLGRRLVETQVFRYSGRSRMSVLQLVHGLVYYTFLCMHLRDKVIRHRMLFCTLNVLQTATHYCVFVRRRLVYSHYAAELLLYLTMFLDIGTVELFLNAVYVGLFVFSTVRNRRNKDDALCSWLLEYFVPWRLTSSC